MDKLASRGHLSFTLLLQMNGYRMEEIDLPARFRKGEGIMQPTLLSSHRRNNFLRLEEMLTPRELLATLTLSKLNFSNQASRKGGFLAGKVLMAMRAEAPQSGTVSSLQWGRGSSTELRLDLHLMVTSGSNEIFPASHLMRADGKAGSTDPQYRAPGCLLLSGRGPAAPSGA